MAITTDKRRDSFLSIEMTKKQQILKKALKENSGFSYTAGYALFFSIVFATVGTVIIPIPGVGAGVGALLGGLIGAWWGHRKWGQQIESVKKEEDESLFKDQLVDLKIKLEESLINRVPIIGHIVQSIKWLSKKFDEHKQNVMVADLVGGAGVAVGYEIGSMAGSLIAPGVGTIVGSMLGSVLGLVTGMVIGGQGSSFLKNRFNISYEQQRVTAAGSIAGAGLGTALGALIGTFALPGIGTVIGAAIGASVGAIGGGAFAAISYKNSEKGFLEKFSNFYSMGPGISGGAMLGGLVGSVIMPVLGTVIGTAVGAVVGAGLAWGITRYGHHLNKRDKDMHEHVDQIIKEVESSSVSPVQGREEILANLSEAKINFVEEVVYDVSPAGLIRRPLKFFPAVANDGVVSVKNEVAPIESSNKL